MHLLTTCAKINKITQITLSVFLSQFFSNFNPLCDVLLLFCRPEPWLWICELRGPKGCGESHQYPEWLETSDQNHQGKDALCTLHQLCWRASTSPVCSLCLPQTPRYAVAVSLLGLEHNEAGENVGVEREPIVNLGTCSFAGASSGVELFLWLHVP